MWKPSANSLERGSLFENRYRIGELVGRGSYAEVYRATDSRHDGAVVAIKLLTRTGQRHSIHAERIVEIERFVHEARTLQLITSPQIPALFDYGQTSRGEFYMATEFVEGEPLRFVLEREGALASHRVIKILEQLLMALRDAHECGLVHRDVKPENIVIYASDVERDLIKLVDFGLSNSYSENAMLTKLDVTDPGFAVGTPMYMSPDQLKGLELGPASDLYAVGLIGYEMIAGEPAVARAHKLLQAKQHLDPEPFRLTGDHDAAPWLVALVERLCAKELSGRYHLAARALADLRAGRDAERDEEDTTGVFMRPDTSRPPGPPPAHPAPIARLNQDVTRDLDAPGSGDDLTATYEFDAVEVPSVTHRLELSDYELALAQRAAGKFASDDALPESTAPEVPSARIGTRPERPSLRRVRARASERAGLEREEDSDATVEHDLTTANLVDMPAARDDSTMELDAALLKQRVRELDGRGEE
jgi:serine/threonine protein kinase